MSTIHSKKNLLKRTAKLEKELAAKGYALKIESALEKVSIAAMSMRRSNDLSGIGSLIFKELKKLGFTDLRNTEIIINNDANETITSYYYSDYGVTGVIELDYKSNAIVKGWADQLKKASNAFAEVVIPGKEMKAWRKYREEIGYLPDPKLDKAKTVYYYSYSTGPGALSISSFKPVAKEQIKILKRFRNVFQLSYQRYADITLAAAQAREAEIELALERVRARTMAMQKSDELPETAFLLFQQLKDLGETAAQLSIGIIKEEQGVVELSATVHGSPLLQTYSVPASDPYFMQKVIKPWKAKEKFLTVEIRGKELKEYNKWRNSVLKKKIVFPEKQWIINVVFFSKGMISFSSEKHISRETIQLLERFAGVFDLTYTRFLDLQKAEDQAREAMIEMALERVRASSMAMHRSDELDKVIKEVTVQLMLLGFDFDASNITIDPTPAGLYVWNASPAQPIPSGVYIPYKDIDLINWIYSSWAFHEGVTTKTFNKAQKNAFFKHYFTHTGARNISDERKKYILNAKSLHFSFACRKDFALGLINYHGIIYTEEQNNIIARFAKVFEQSYVRFLDLQKAEAQAREAQIELALERVRARTMAMQKSDELAEAAQLLYHEFGTLGINTITCGYMFIDEEKNIQTAWTALPDGTLLPNFIDFPLTGDHVLNKRYEDWKQKKPLHIFEIQGEVNKEHHRFLSNYVPPFVVKDIFSQLPDKIVFHCANFSNGYLLILATDHFSPGDQQTIIRFAKVFEMTYRRFLDLQQAEAQVRESQIQLALERVRARTMAMHKSVELAETAQVLFHQLQELGGIPDRIAIGVADEAEGVVNFWSTDQSGSHIDKSFKARLNERTVMLKTYQAWKDHKKSLVIDLHGDDVKEWIQFAREEMGVVVKDEFIKDRRVHNFVFFSHGWILVTTHEPQSAETIRILERFALVFSLTYRRFLDLQRAEAQAREAQIEAALERVRARSMAMHHSTELHAAADVLFQQLRIFGGNIMNAGIALCTQDADEDEYWLSSDSGLRPVISIPHTEDPIQKKLYEDWKNKSEFYSIAKGGDELKAHYNYLRSVAHLKPFFEEGPDWSFPTWQKWHAAYFSHGYLFMITLEPYDEEKILVRFARVFEQAYRRFLDLQKAEAQAKEAQIEASLERVRARAMAMHGSDELKELVKTLFEELIRLDVKLATCLISTFDISTLDETSWMFHPITREPYVKRIPYNAQPFYHEMLRAWKERNAAWNYCLEGETKVKWNDFLFTDTEFAHLPQSVIDEMRRPDKVFFTASYYSYGAIQAASLEPFPVQSIDIIQRFSKVFDLSYTRFLDLKKAEAQAREAQIEAALEKVRSRSLAMHKSDELQEVVNTVFERLRELNVEMDSANIAIFKEGTRDYDYWIASPVQKRSAVFHMPYIDPGISKDLMDARETHTDVFLKTYSFEEKNEWFERSFQKTDFKFLDKQRKKFILDAEGITVAIAFAKNTGVQVNRYSSKSLAEAEIDLLKRFSKVFEQAYIRFLDLQKAEAQARESQIETSLERVRSKTMAMHNSNDVGETVAAMFAEFVYLGIHTNRCGILIFNDQYTAEVWTARSTHGGNAKLIIGKLDLDAHKMLRSLYNAWNAKETFYQYDLLDDDLVQYYTAINNLKFYPTQFDLNALPSKEFHSDFFFADGAVFSFTNEPVIEAHSKIMNRFASVFGQTYRRYLDLQKAEAQAREAKIEAALEKVRSRSLAMHKSQEIQEVINEVFIRLRELEINLDSANILIFENGSKDTVCWTGSTASNSTSSLLRYADIDFLKDMISAKEDQLELFTRQYSREQKNEFFNYVYETTALKETPGDRKQFILEAPCHAVSVAFSKNIAINLNSYSRESFTESENNIVRRFSKVFEQSYTRFLDLQKAEAQAREAQTEVALERVRAKAMAMHDSDDLNETIKVFYQQISLLSLKPRRCGVGLFNNENRMAEVSVMNTTEQGESIDTIGKMELAGHPVLEAIYENWLSQQDYFPILRGNQIKEYYQLLRPHLNYPDYPHDAVQYGYFFYFKEGALYAWTTEELSEEELKIYRRFNSVLSLTYKRYKDLKQAEKNAREAQIEAGLERVRARTMAMFKSDELAETAVVVFKQMKGLGIIPNRLYIVIINDDSGNMEFWITDENGDKIGSRHVVNINKNISLKTMYDGWAGKKKTIIIDQQGNELQDWLSYWKENFGVSFKDDTTIKRRVQTIAYFSRGFIAIASPGDEPRSTINLLERFAAVFNLTYTRFNDLQIAEAQAMEAQIEAGLERVRARTMAMHNSEDVSAATATMFTELEKLGVENLRCGITIIHKNKTQEVWSVSNIMSDVDGNSVERKNVLAAGMFDMNAHPLWRLLYEKWDNKEDFLQYYLAGKDKEDYFKILNTTKDYLPQAIQQFPDTNFQVYFFGEGAVWSVSLQPHSEEHKQIMKRFTSVFSLTFRRYQDLKKAEAQAREATIEAALEKVRGKAMAMHNSNDLSVTASMVFTELRKLGINPIRCGVGLLNKESRKAQLYSATSSADGDSLSLVGWAILSEHPVLEKIYQSWMDNKEYYPELQGEQMRSYYQLLLKGLPVAVPLVEDDKKQYGTFLPFSVGCLYAWSDVRYNEVEIKILKRFATIIDLTFRRYLELQKSEANAREAVKQAAVDRIRADIASMRTIGDLDRITPLIWNELTILGLPFIRCGVFIMDNSQKLIHTFLSTPDGKAIGAFHLPYDTPGSFADMVIHWENKKTFITHWGEIDMLVMADILVKQGAIATKEQYLRSLPGEGFYLHFLPFLQGMLYVANLEKLNDEQIELIQHVADAFSTAYARYEDFNRLEAAKQQVEKTLTDLKQAQTLLVQSEKMASLGELTAGIAHEIQNPLNFVNNFSEVSNELLEEMKMELEKGNNEDALAIAKDVKQNLEKINHHGKRADSIVKGMLQHSRTSSGQKEMTDINSLADEYLRLAYHGLRAKEKSFNAKFETSFDKNVGEINIIPQDIGRVILNLINNAFYAVSERKKQGQADYEPTVTITTIKDYGKIGIKVKDNGNGIPQRVLDKIFQPFFTTKPTGQGTGLGLSLAYDIIKAHGGDIRVETKEGEGSEFIIQLPI